MKLGDFRDPSGFQIADLDHLKDVVDAEGDCETDDITLAASSLLAGIENPRDLSFSEKSIQVGQPSDLSIIHEVETDAGSQLIGYFSRPTVRLPTTVEEIAAQYLLRSDEETLEPGTKVVFYSAGFQSQSHFDVYHASVKSEKGSFLDDHLQSIALTGSLETDGSHQRTSRYYQQSLKNRLEKYGALELYRSLESSFLSMILAGIVSQFHIDAEKSLRNATDALKKERLQLASACKQLSVLGFATRIARTVNRQGPLGNQLAESLKYAFDKDQSPTPQGVENSEWQGIWYVYQLRCSIAHAGAKGIVFEDFGTDGETLLREIYIDLEQMVLGALGVTV